MKLQDLLVAEMPPKDPYDFEDEERTVPEVEGEMYPETLGDVKVGEDVAVYTAEKEGRPWVGRTLQVNEKDILIHWFERKKRKVNTYEQLVNRDNSPQTDMIARSSIMFRCISSVTKKDSFQVTPTWQERIMEEYIVLDEKMSAHTPSP